MRNVFTFFPVILFFVVSGTPLFGTPYEEELLTQLRSSDREVRLSAADKLGQLARGQVADQPPLSSQIVIKLKDIVKKGKSIAEREGAAWALGEIADPSTVEFLKRRAKYEATQGDPGLALILEHSSREICPRVLGSLGSEP